jgi:hypothetical protein
LLDHVVEEGLESDRIELPVLVGGHRIGTKVNLVHLSGAVLLDLGLARQDAYGVLLVGCAVEPAASLDLGPHVSEQRRLVAGRPVLPHGFAPQA